MEKQSGHTMKTVLCKSIARGSSIIPLFSVCVSQGDIVFVIDAGSPNAIRNWNQIRETVAFMISTHYYGYRAIRVAIVLYGRNSEVCRQLVVHVMIVVALLLNKLIEKAFIWHIFQCQPLLCLLFTVDE